MTQYFYFQDDGDPTLLPIDQFSAPANANGVHFIPKRNLNFAANEVGRFVRLDARK